MAEAPTSSPLTHTYKVTLWKDGLCVSVDGAFMTAFPIEGLVGGYCSYEGPGDATYQEFGDKFDIIWDTAEAAGQALSRLLEGRRAKLIERKDGSVALSRFDTPLGDLGAQSTPLVQIDTTPNMGQPMALVEMVGAEERGWFINKVRAAQMGPRYQRQDNPTLLTQQAAIEEARRVAVLSQEMAEGASFYFHAADPAAECEDEVEVESADYIVTATEFGYTIDDQGQPKITGTVRVRAKSSAGTVGVYGTSQYGDGDVYG